jgi:voltage-gated potassium channel
VNEEENIKLITQAGADAIIAPSVVGGHLMANSVQSSHISDYVNDPMCIEGRVRLIECQASPEEVGKSMRELGPGLVVRVYRGNTRVGFWEGQRAMIQPGNLL